MSVIIVVGDEPARALEDHFTGNGETSMLRRQTVFLVCAT
jgi:hypothetical protein